MRPSTLAATLAALLAATPALAHHEVIASASIVPLATGGAAIAIAALAAWRRYRQSIKD
ncbi:MAG: hypothetical protein WAO69_02475 [Aestuariivita sp.]|uniref:hypothetical protein n=1 Tax=Aestuariivita sp. TaxID=1872407 RepID=UPI003BAE858F